MTATGRTRPRPRGAIPDTATARALGVALFDLAWLLPRTVGAEERLPDPLPRSEREVMRMLGRRPGATVNAVARELGLRPSNVSASIRSLVERGLVERRSDPQDGRQVRLFLTQDAQVARERRERLWGKDFRRLLGELPPEQRTRLVDALPALSTLVQQLSEIPT